MPRRSEVHVMRKRAVVFENDALKVEDLCAFTYPAVITDF
jgi:hypothetical protein